MDTAFDASPAKSRTCFPLWPLPPHIRARYDRLVLVTEARHVAQLDALDAGSLIVSSDWLLWQQCADDGRHAVHLDLGLLDWDGKQAGHDHLIWANDWIYSGGRDMTLFRGVSLGRKFYRQVALVIADHLRLSAMLDSLIRRFQASELAFYDCRTEDGFMDVEGRVAVAADAARRAGVAFADRRQPSDAHESGYPRAGTWDRVAGSSQTVKNRLKQFVVTACMQTWGRISLAKRRMNRSLPGILMVVTYLVGKPLIDGFRRNGLMPMYLGRWLPHKAKFLYWLANFRKGVLPVDAARPALDREDLAALDNMEREIKRTLTAAPGAANAAIRRYLTDRVIDSGGLREMAKEVKWAERVVDEFRPDLVVTDGLMDVTSLIILELAKRRGIPNAVTWHGPYIEDVKVDMFGCDPRRESLADYSLTWGKAHEDWLDGIGAKTRNIRTGNLVSSDYRQLPPPPKRANVMVNQYVSTNHDFVTPMSYEFFYFVEIVRMLAELGYSSIRMRFHPGTSKRRYYNRIRDFFGLECDFNDTGSYRESVEWADFVVGPANSGAMLETVAAGRPYYPVSLKPHANNARYVSGSPMFDDLESLRRHLESGRLLDQNQLLENFTSIREFPNAAQRTWQVIESIVLDGKTGRASAAGAAARPGGRP